MGNGNFRSPECIDLLKQLETKLKKNNVFFTSIRAKDLYFNNFKKLLKCSAIDRNAIINKFYQITPLEQVPEIIDRPFISENTVNNVNLHVDKLCNNEVL